MRIYTMETTLADFAARYHPHDRLVLLGRLEQLDLDYIDTGAPGPAAIYHVPDFFDAFAADHQAALGLLKRAKTAGASILSLGGTALPREAAAICAEVRKRFNGILAIRPAGELAVA